MQNIGKVLRIARYANNMSLIEASAASTVSNVYIYELESGKKTNVSEEYLTKLATGYGLILEQLVKLEEFYTNFEGNEERKYRRTLIETLKMIDKNCVLRANSISRTKAKALIELANNVDTADNAVEMYLGPSSYKEKIACITGMFDVPEIIDRQLEDTDEQVYYIYLTNIINNY